MMNLKHRARSCLFAFFLAGLVAPAWSQASPGEPAEDWEKVVFHLDETANARWALLLARSYLDDRPRAKIVLVAYGPGIDFLLEDAEDKRGNPYAPAVLGLVERGVEFRVCQGTLDARGIASEDFLDAVAVVPSGIGEIARLQIREGFAYLKP